MASNQHPKLVSVSLERKFAASFNRSGGDLLVFPKNFCPWKSESVLKLSESGTHLDLMWPPPFPGLLAWACGQKEETEILLLQTVAKLLSASAWPISPSYFTF